MSTEPNAPDPSSDSASAAASADAPPPASPYRNLWVPLVLVPALIVVVLVLIFLLFGGIAGSESTIRADLDTAVHGGANERTQAVFKLTQKMLENRQALEQGEPEPWETGPELVPELRRAWDNLDEEDHQIRYVVASLLLLEGETDAGAYLGEFLELGEKDDPGGVLRLNALMSLALAGDERALDAAVAMAQEDDKGARINAMMVLSKLDGDAADDALVAGLQDGELEVRANAAIALSGKRDPRGAEVLVSLLDPATIADEHEKHPDRYREPDAPRNVRMAAVEALGKLGRPADRAVLQRVAREDPDLEVRRSASEALAASEGATQD